MRCTAEHVVVLIRESKDDCQRNGHSKHNQLTWDGFCPLSLDKRHPKHDDQCDNTDDCDVGIEVRKTMR